MSQLKFQNPPRHGRKRIDWEDVASQLRARPGKWALLGNMSNVFAWNIRSGVYAAMPVGEFEATCRNTKDGKADIYARYIGEHAA